ncbi:MAG: nuclear transport factor 2 family protein [Patulibacter sp.]|nr:nuclear transport factor 2 family protein [Patulibacter sp.]
MTQANVEVVRAFEEAMIPGVKDDDGGDARDTFAKIRELLDPEVVFRPAPSLPHGGVHVGFEGFMRMGELLHEHLGLDGDVTFECFDGPGDKVFILLEFVFVSKATGRSAPTKMVEVVTVRDGRIKELEAYYTDTAAIVEAMRESEDADA